MEGFRPTPLQRSLLYRAVLSPGSGCYIQQLVWSMPEPPRLDLLRLALEDAAARHDALRAFFRWEETSEAREFFAPAVVVALEVRDEGSTVCERTTDPLAAFLAQDRARGFELSAPPMWRVTVLRQPDGQALCIWSFHHLLLDGRSHLRVVEEVLRQYHSLCAGRRLELSVSPSFTEFLDWLERQPSDTAAGYWRDRLAGIIDVPALPSLAANPDAMRDDEPQLVEEVILDEATTADLRTGAERHGVTLNNLLQGAWALALSRYNAVEDVVFGVVRAGRHWGSRDGTEHVGLFINTVPFRVNTAPGQTIGAWLRSLREQQLAVRTGEFAAPEQIRDWAGLPRAFRLLRSIVMFESSDWRERLAGLGHGWTLHEKTDVLTLAASAGSRLTLALAYASSQHTPAQIRLILQHLRTLLANLAAAPAELPLRDIALESAEASAAALEPWQGPRTALPEEPLCRILEQQARATPDTPAVEFLDSVLSHAELHRRANQLARRLIQLAGPQERICTLLDRSPDLIVAWLAVLKAGLVYAPLDPGNPRERLAFCLQDLAPSVVLTQRDLARHLPLGDLRTLVLDDDAERALQQELDASDLPSVPAPEAAANILFTSGSTGVPKGAVNSHGGLNNIAAVMRRSLGLSSGDRVLLLSTASFDASILEIVLALQAGATAVLAPTEQMRPGAALAQFLTDHRITAIVPTPSVLRLTPASAFPDLRLIVCCGEPLSLELLERWGTNRRFLNIYGPTECSIYTTCEECHADGTRPTIGRLVENARGYILDEKRRPVPVGVPGELFIGGAGVGLGYWNRPDLTAGRFLPDPFVERSGARMYRTGDLVRWLSDGRLEYLQRLDFQVKFQGVRLELGEIEANLVQHPRVQSAVVLLVEDQLRAWLVATGAAPTPTELRAWLASRIPLSLIPSAFTFLPELPRTTSGKTDRQALRALALAPAAEPRRRLREWNRTERPFPRERSVVDFFRDQARARADCPALKDENRTLSYRELERLSNRVAQRLVREGLRLEEPVALLLERSCEFAIAALGVLKAGGAYVPMDAKTPAQRLAFLLSDCGARFLLAGAASRECCPEWKGLRLLVDPACSAFGGELEAAPSVPSDPSRRAYLIYTSGSTGQPKGVEIEHHSLTNLVCFYQRRLKLTPRDRTTLIANVAFDASVADLWPGLCTGGAVLIPPVRLLTELDGLIAWLAEEGATFTFVPTALAELMFERSWPAQMAMRFLATGGDTLRKPPPAGLPFTVLNTYGPTENTVDSTWSVLSATSDAERPPIGRPIDNVTAYVLDEHGEPAATGVAGELYLGGEQVARGYLGRPELTRERFLPDPFADKAGARMYRTGDWARWREDGELEFIGRQDDQVQVHGQRIELGEIEQALCTHPAVRMACCRPLRADGAVVGITAHVVPAPGQADLEEALRRHLRERLPGAMVPRAFVFHDHLPITAQGKVDRAALDAAAPATDSTSRVAPSGDSTEQALTRLWLELLPTAATAPGGLCFGALGGDSLVAVKLLLGVEEITGQRLALSTFLLEPTLAGLCQAVRRQDASTHSPVIALRRRGKRPPIFLLYEVSGDVGAYFDLADALGTDQPIFGVRSPALHDLAALPKTMEEAGTQAARCIREFHGAAAPVLVGFSWGGLLAYEVARQWRQYGEGSPFVAMIGSAAPIESTTSGSRLWHLLRWFPHWFAGWTRDHGNRRRRLLAAVRRWAGRPVLQATPSVPDWASSPIVRAHVELGYRYFPKISEPVQIDLFRERLDYSGGAHPLNPHVALHQPDAGWGRWTGCPPRVHWVETKHLDILKPPAVRELAASLRAALDQRFGL